MRIDVLTLFPEMFGSVLGSSILKRAAETVTDPAAPDDRSRDRPPVVSYHLHDIRAYTADKHQKVDQPPFGGGPGMVIQCQPVWDAVRAVEAQQPDVPPRRVLVTPKGVPLTQPLVEALAAAPRLLILAGHYEGFDQRVLDALHATPPGSPATAAGEPPDPQGDHLLEISLGDYVLSGGELPAMVLIDAVVRLLPGALGDDASAHHDSFSPGASRLLDHPHYTRPRTWAGRAVPGVLLSGDHAKIEAWRSERARQLTEARRPDLNAPPPTAADPAAPIVIRDASPDDDDAVDALLRAAFPGDDEARLVAALRDADELPLALVAERDGQIVGHLAFSPAHVDAAPDVRLLALAPLAVHPAHQRSGVGSALVRGGLDRCRRLGAEAVVVLGDSNYYARFGFEPARDHGLSDRWTAGEHLMVLPLAGPLVPECVGEVRYAAAFDALG